MAGQSHAEVAEGAYVRLEVGESVVVLGVACDLLGCALGTEVVCVCARSVAAFVHGRDDRGEQLALGPGKP
jgi:hypothetical protein